MKQGKLRSRGANLIRLPGEDDVMDSNRVPVGHSHEQSSDRYVLLGLRAGLTGGGDAEVRSEELPHGFRHLLCCG